MSRLNQGRYNPRWTYPDEPVTPAEHWALKHEFWVMAFLVAVMLFCVFAEPLMTWIGIGVR
jgi:hypothetical protein